MTYPKIIFLLRIFVAHWRFLLIKVQSKTWKTFSPISKAIHINWIRFLERSFETPILHGLLWINIQLTLCYLQFCVIAYYNLHIFNPSRNWRFSSWFNNFPANTVLYSFRTSPHLRLLFLRMYEENSVWCRNDTKQFI